MRARAASFISPAVLTKLAVHGLVVWLYVWFGTGGSFHFRDTANYYGELADALLAGQLHLKIAPVPELAALPDPYAPEQNEPYRLHDAVYYGGRYYLYWGPVPALLHAAWMGLTGWPSSNNAMVVLFGLGGCLWF